MRKRNLFRLPPNEMAADTPQATKHRPTDPVPSNTPFGEMKIPDPWNRLQANKIIVIKQFFLLIECFIFYFFFNKNTAMPLLDSCLFVIAVLFSLWPESCILYNEVAAL